MLAPSCPLLPPQSTPGPRPARSPRRLVIHLVRCYAHNTQQSMIKVHWCWMVFPLYYWVKSWLSGLPAKYKFCSNVGGMYYCTLYMKRFLGCQNTLIAFIEFFYCQYCSSITPMLSTLLNLLSDLCINHWKTLQSQNEKISIFSISLGTQCRQSQWQCLG